MKNKYFSLLLVLLLLFGVSLLVKDQEGYLFVENRPKTQLFDIQKDISINKLNSILEDQIYFRDDIINGFLKVFDKYSFGENVICYNRDQIKIGDVYYDNSYTKLDYSLLDTCSNKAFNINELSNKYPEIKVYLYNPVRYLSEPILDSIWFPNNYEIFENSFVYYLGDKVKYRKLNYEDDKISDYFYKTDRHYNVYGADQTYRDIVNMINEDVDIGQPKELVNILEINNSFRGSYAKNCENSDGIYDRFSAGEYDIDSNLYDYYINGIRTTINDERKAIIKKDAFSNYRLYDTYYNSNSGEEIFDYKDSSKNNILIITDSYIGPIKEVLSSHFNKSVIICGDQSLQNLSLDKTIKENNIDMILILWFQQNLYYNGYYFIPIN